jgi:hypothetical protein
MIFRKKILLNQEGKHPHFGCCPPWHPPPPVCRPRLFCSTSRIDRIMIDAVYKQHHSNQAGE